VTVVTVTGVTVPVGRCPGRRRPPPVTDTVTGTIPDVVTVVSRTGATGPGACHLEVTLSSVSDSDPTRIRNDSMTNAVRGMSGEGQTNLHQLRRKVVHKMCVRGNFGRKIFEVSPRSVLTAVKGT
jgi:hypothetical protein